MQRTRMLRGIVMTKACAPVRRALKKLDVLNFSISWRTGARGGGKAFQSHATRVLAVGVTPPPSHGLNSLPDKRTAVNSALAPPNR